LLPEQNLKKKYGSDWAIVTGSSSGIGKSLTVKLAQQGINVVMVALEDETFRTTFNEVQKKFPNVLFRQVGCDLSRPGYLPVIAKACADIEPTLIFNNAGFLSTGNFADSTLEKQMGNYECNSISPVNITHHFVNQMLDKKRKGAVFFTSSPAGLIPNPTSVMYGSTKSFLTEFGSSLAPELRGDGIDVLVVHPSPVNTSFYSGNKHGLDSVKLFQSTATTPDLIASCFFRGIGRTVIYDQGYFCVVVRLLLKIIDITLFVDITNWTAKWVGDLKKTKRDRSQQSSPSAAEKKTSKKK